MTFFDDEDGLLGTNDAVRLTEEQFLAICNGQDLRNDMRDGTMDETLIRASAAIMLIMFRVYPGSLTQEEIWRRVNRKRYDLMEDGAFREEVRIAVAEKLN